jgi:hypothetical protein
MSRTYRRVVKPIKARHNNAIPYKRSQFIPEIEIEIEIQREK